MFRGLEMREIEYLVQNKNTIILPAYAKINLYLKIENKRTDNYHNLKMIMQEISLHDDVQISVSDDEKGEIAVSMYDDSFNLLNDIEMKSNIVYKVSFDFIKKYEIKNSVNIKIIKRIPVMAGLAGGSSDAAAALLGLNMYFELGLSNKELSDFSVKYGADIPFCLRGGLMKATSVGEELESLPYALKKYVLLAVPNKRISTKEAFCIYDRKKSALGVDYFDEIMDSFKNNDNSYLNFLSNDFEEIAEESVPEIIELKNCFLENGALKTMVTGSGSAVFALFDDFKNADSCYKKMRKINMSRMFFSKTLL